MTKFGVCLNLLRPPALVMLLALSFLSSHSLAQTELLEEPTGEIIATEHDKSLRIETKKFSYQIPSPSTDEQREFNGLSDEEKTSFQKNRLTFLAKVARALEVTRYLNGIGSLTKDKVLFQIAKLRKRDEKQQHYRERLQMTFKERTYNVTDRLLKALDKNLWHQATVFSRSNEFGFTGALGLALMSGTFDEGRGGLVTLGFTLGYNADSKALVFQIFSDIEKYKSSVLPFVFLAGGIVKTGTYNANQKGRVLSRQGVSFYPPVIPGYTSMSSDYYSVGFSSGATIPPPPVGDILTYTNTLDQQVWFRVSLSPLQWGFIRVETDLFKMAYRWTTDTVMNSYEKIQARFRATQCSAIYH